MVEHFQDLSDPRVPRTKDHDLIDILVIAVCTLLCAGESFSDLQDFCQAKRDWFKTFLTLRNGIPSLCMANCYSCGDWQLEQPLVVGLSGVVVEVGGSGSSILNDYLTDFHVAQQQESELVTAIGKSPIVAK